MRNRPPFECPQCGMKSPVGVKCEGCRVEMLDQQGWPGIGRPLRFFRGGSLTHTMASLGHSIRRWRGGRARQQLELTGIADARDGEVRIAGRVHVLRSVEIDGFPAAAFFRRKRHVTKTVVSTRYGDRPYDAINYEEHGACGRFAVIDETGVAIVDDDCFDLFHDVDDDVVSVVVADGDRVEIVGHAAWGDAADARDLALSSGYRETPRALWFDGRPQAHLRIFVLA